MDKLGSCPDSLPAGESKSDEGGWCWGDIGRVQENFSR